jgi:serine/threonine protein kinase
VAFDMANGGLPPAKNDLASMFITVTDPQPPQLKDPLAVSTTFQNFLSSCLNKDPEKRPIPEELYKHDFITTGPARPAMQQRIQNLFSMIENLANSTEDADS